MRVMIVDDDVDDIEFLIQALQEFDQAIEYVYAFNGLDAMNLLRHADKKPDCIFLDLNMPKMNGNNFLKQIKDCLDFQHIPVVILSTSSRAQDARDAMQHGAKEFIIKPNTLGELTARVAVALKKIID